MAKKKARVPTAPAAKTKKRRTPPPPRATDGGTAAPPRRPVQAPKVKTGRDGERWRPSRLVLALAGSGVVALVAALGIVFLVGSGGDSGLQEGRIAGTSCTLSFHPTSPPNQHTTNENLKVKYSTFPPSSGRHHVTPAIWNFYDKPVAPIHAVHNLEHGGIVIWYGPRISAAEKTRLRGLYNESPNSMLATPYPPLGRRVALTAWVATGGKPTKDGGKVMMCASADEANIGAMRRFRDEFRGKGPEKVPVSYNRPGT